jgi:excisionase family DNA binding protein
MSEGQVFDKGDLESVPQTRMLTAAEVAHLLHVHPNTIRLWSRIGVLKAYRIGKRRDYRFRAADIQSFLLRNGNPD